MTTRVGTLSLLFGVLCAACAPRSTNMGGAKSGGAAPPFAAQMHGMWSGKASKSPLGVQPYALAFDREAADVIAETPPTIGEEKLPPGAYQRFRFSGGVDATRLEYKTAMGEKDFLEGTLDLSADGSSATKRRYCDAAGCDRFELRWESLGPAALSFQVWVEGRLHADIALEFDGDR